jgi:large subunit ribosomal protein L38
MTKIKGKLPEDAKTLAQRLADMKYKDPALHFKVDIGFPAVVASRKTLLPERLKHRSELRKNEKIELAARNRTLSVPLDRVYEEWETTDGPSQLQQTADYFNVFEDLFGEAYFRPNTPLRVTYNFKKAEDVISSVYRGNLLKPIEAAEKPDVVIKGDKDSLYTLQMTTPDGHLTKEKGEYLHWLIGNIPGNDVRKGQELCGYLQPFPARGLGYCRYIFVLYKQDKSLDFTKYKRSSPCFNLSARTFSTLDFYRELQDFMTPCGLAFFQSDWDQTLTSFFQKVLEMPEPSFEYDFPAISYPKQKWFPGQKPFNLYLDKYKEEKQLQKELLIEKLKERHPFKPPPKRPKYPLAFRLDTNTASWINDDIRRRRMREGKWKLM